MGPLLLPPRKHRMMSTASFCTKYFVSRSPLALLRVCFHCVPVSRRANMPLLEQVALTPDQPALSDGKSTITYRELDEMSDRLAFWLQEQGCGMECVGVIYMKKQIEYVIAYTAILKAHAAYLPMDAAYPPDLIDMVLKDAQPKAIITTPEYFEKSGSKFGDIPSFVCDKNWQSKLPAQRISPARPPGMTWENMAYTIYSSGTTGKPKGIVCPHRGAVLSYNYRHVQYPYFEGEREAANVFLVWECFRPLLKGAQLFVIPDDLIYDVDSLPVFLEENKIDRMMFTPSLLDAVLSNPEVKPERLQSLKLIIYCGEVVTVALRNKCREILPNCRLHNLYSISECHDVTGSDLTLDSSLDLKRTYCPVGKLLPHAVVLVLDENMEEVPPGVQGEIYVMGPYLARGYLRRPELTASRFPTRNGERMYRTGDWGYLIRGGELEICGRCDSMVKVRGYSIELLAVQKALLDIKDLVSDAIVIAHGDAAATEKTLVAYVIVPADKQSRAAVKMAKELRALLKRRLPFYMVPTYIEFMPYFPSTAIGKVDKTKLPSLASIQEKQGLDADNKPHTPHEIQVRGAMCMCVRGGRGAGGGAAARHLEVRFWGETRMCVSVRAATSKQNARWPNP
jgi:amino acid adenylation domain-containing protein